MGRPFTPATPEAGRWMRKGYGEGGLIRSSGTDHCARGRFLMTAPDRNRALAPVAALEPQIGLASLAPVLEGAPVDRNSPNTVAA